MTSTAAETALKALYWSTLVYRYDETAPDLTRDPPAMVRCFTVPRSSSQNASTRGACLQAEGRTLACPGLGLGAQIWLECIFAAKSPVLLGSSRHRASGGSRQVSKT